MADDREKHHTKAYERMLERVTEAMEQAEEKAKPRLREALERARKRAVELGELTTEEAERIADYVRRDVEDAARYLSKNQEDMAGWFRMDMQLLENWLLDRFSMIADRTRVELMELSETLERAAHWHTGEITGPGELRCESCGKVMRFEKAGHIPPCPKCSHTSFERITRETEDSQE